MNRASGRCVNRDKGYENKFIFLLSSLLLLLILLYWQCCCCWTPKGKIFLPFQWDLLRITNKRINITKNLSFYAFLIISFLFILHLWLNFTRLAYEWRLIECKQLDSSILYWDGDVMWGGGELRGKLKILWFLYIEFYSQQLQSFILNLW
mgnify:CR=1 FL=1